MIRRPPRSPLFPSTPLSRSVRGRPPADGLAILEERDALGALRVARDDACDHAVRQVAAEDLGGERRQAVPAGRSDQRDLGDGDRKSTRLNSSHGYISYAVFC